MTTESDRSHMTSEEIDGLTAQFRNLLAMHVRHGSDGRIGYLEEAREVVDAVTRRIAWVRETVPGAIQSDY